MPYRNPTNKMLLLVMYAGVLFWVLPAFFTGDTLQEFFNSIVFGIASAVLVTWGASAYYALRGNITGVHQHIVATVAIWLIVWLQRLYSIVFLTMDRPYWMQISSFPAFITYMFGIMGVFVVVAPAFVDEETDQRDYVLQAAIGTGIGMVAAVVSYVIQYTH
jgi:hypothetical protein